MDFRCNKNKTQGPFDLGNVARCLKCFRSFMVVVEPMVCNATHRRFCRARFRSAGPKYSDRLLFARVRKTELFSRDASPTDRSTLQRRPKAEAAD